ncbi:MAG: MFS transporter [Actinomyces sp.]|nr:MFS transporter [uncultured Actinomyces sp.]
MSTRSALGLPPFMRKGRLVPFLTVAVSGEVLYSAFEAFKGALMIPLQEMLGISQIQFGLLMTYVGLALFFYLPAGWINNRFRVRTIILCSLGWRLVTYLVLFLLDPPFGLMAAIAVTWAIVDAIVWPAVANGVCVLAADEDQKGRGLAMGLLESIRRFVEFALNGIVIVVLMFLPDATTTVMRVFAIAYTLLIVPMMIAVVRYVPDTRIATQARASHSVAALKGLLHVLSRPRIWLAGIAAMTVYWADINLMYVSAPYLQQVFHVSTAMSGAFGLLNTGLVAIVAGVVSGIVSDYVFKSSTRMMAVALGCVAVTCGLVLLLPVTRVMIIPILVLLIVVALATFLGKSVILAPIGELELPEEIAGSAMAVGSFLAYASILWGYNLNGYLLDSHASDPAAGYRIIFMITAGVTVIGCATAVILDRVNRRAAMRVDTVDGAADADDRTAADS